MPFLITFSRIIKSTLQHLTRSPYHTLAAVMVMTLTFFATSLFVLVAFGSNAILKYFENKPQVTAFFKDQTSEDYILQLKGQLEQTGQATTVKYISQNEALSLYKKQNSQDPELLEFVTADILPASLEVSAVKLEYLSDLANTLAADSRVEKVIYQKDVVESLQSWALRIRVAGFALIGFLALISVLIVLVIISMNIATFGKEIEVMRLVGATSWYVRWPFILDGAIYGFLSATISTVLLVILLPRLSQYASDLIRGIEIMPQGPIFLLQIWGGTVAAAVLLGVLGSLMAVRKHLRV